MTKLLKTYVLGGSAVGTLSQLPAPRWLGRVDPHRRSARAVRAGLIIAALAAIVPIALPGGPAHRASRRRGTLAPQTAGAGAAGLDRSIPPTPLPFPAGAPARVPGTFRPAATRVRHPLAVLPAPAIPPTTLASPATLPSPAPNPAIAVTPRQPPGSPPAPAVRDFARYQVALLFGGVQIRSLLGTVAAARFATFPSAAQPVATFLGLDRDGRTARFLLYGDVGVSGDGRCLWYGGHCTFLSLRPGQRELITIGARRYGLGYLSLAVAHIPFVGRPPEDISPGGRRLVAEVGARLPELRTLEYSASGLLLTHLR